MHSTPRFLQGVCPFTGQGLDTPVPLDAVPAYVVPDGAVGQLVYARAGNSSEQMVVLVLVRDGAPMRYFPVGAGGDMHVPLRIVEDLEAGTTIELWLSAPAGLSGVVVVDVGLMEL